MTDNGAIEERYSELVAAAQFPRWLTVLLAVWITIVTAALTLMYVQLWPLVNDTNTAVNETIGQRDETIADQEIVINQAVVYITDMARQIIELGGEPPEVILDPNKADE